MKSKRDITNRVMKQVVDKEKKTLFRSLAIFVAIFMILFLAFFAVTTRFILDVKALGTWDILTLFWEDREIIREYWRDAFSTIWLEVPTEYLLILLGIILFAGVLYYGSYKKRKLLSVRSQKLRSYEKLRLQK